METTENCTTPPEVQGGIREFWKWSHSKVLDFVTPLLCFVLLCFLLGAHPMAIWSCLSNMVQLTGEMVMNFLLNGINIGKSRLYKRLQNIKSVATKFHYLRTSSYSPVEGDGRCGDVFPTKGLGPAPRPHFLVYLTAPYSICTMYRELLYN